MIVTLVTNKNSFLKKSIDWDWYDLPNFPYKKSQEGGRWGNGKNKDIISLESIANSKSQLPKADDGNHNSTTNNE
jgi:hypothetical protein